VVDLLLQRHEGLLLVLQHVRNLNVQVLDLLLKAHVVAVLLEVLLDLLLELRVYGQPDVAVLHDRELEEQDEDVELLLSYLDLALT